MNRTGNARTTATKNTELRPKEGMTMNAILNLQSLPIKTETDSLGLLMTSSASIHCTAFRIDG